MLISCTSKNEKSSMKILNTNLENQVKEFIKSSKAHSLNGSNCFTVRFLENQNVFRVLFDNINPSTCDSFIGSINYDTINVCFFGGERAKKYFNVNNSGSCDTFIRKDLGNEVPVKIDWYSDEFIFDGNKFSHLTAP